jgi:hypothetical protein
METGDPKNACRAPRTRVAERGQDGEREKSAEHPVAHISCTNLFDVMFELIQRLGFDIKCTNLSSIGQPWTNQFGWKALVKLGAWFVQVVIKVTLATKARES